MDYPFKKEKNNVISNKNNLGANLERDINLTNRFYQEQEIALVYKNEIPIQVVRVEYPQRKQAKIVEAYYRTSSLPDYHGIYKSKFLSFDVKETNNKNNFPLSNIPQHQIEILQRAQKFNGIAFFIVHFKIKNKYFYLPIDFLTNFLNNNKAKSISYQIFEKELFNIPFNYNPRIDYLKVIDKFIE
ncbi:MAG: hypothetical protein PR2021_4910 [Candidatus Phytoplasma pruni]|uniref:Holliday junction resolvase RecU n=1 Tax=Poinsettia branch-inducing phytoplasma TaxID=138647 RepID=UPI00036AC5EA|nr:Holliday junction resolvase RecU [Poinsettia branch-inducing phytoplasma]WEK82557.1 MAG: hypothetical protein PR2021_4910 [Candidatus Phytoplasma pruni]